MKSSAKERLLSLAIVLGLAAVLITLGVLQYRWSREISEATSTRMEASLQTSMMGVRQDLYRELANICLAFQGDPDAVPDKDYKKYIQRFQEWARTATHPGLVANVFIWETGAGKSPRLLRLNGSREEFEPAEWPASFQPVHDRLQATSLDMIVAAVAKLRLKPRPRGLNEPPPDLERGRENRPASIPGYPWRIDQNIPLLVHANIQRNGAAESRNANPTVDWFLIELDSNVLQSHIMPEVAERYFGGAEGLTYEVALVGGGTEPRVIYTSDRGFGTQDPRTADGVMNVFGPPHGPPPDAGAKKPMFRGDTGLGGLRLREGRGPGLLRIEPLRYSANDRDWQLITKHRKGSLEAVVAATRRRNLTISFGVLLLLAASMAMVIVTSLRAQRLAKLQMDFVAAVSHELRTPLAVISSAADNLADGVVESKPQLMQYGSVMKKQARQLTDLVEQILLFAAAREERPRFTLRPLQISEIVDLAINHTAELINAAQFTIEKDVPSDLPPVMADLPAISRCLQNLITNAVKYGGDKRWIGIRARASQDSGKSGEVQIAVQDKGVGIATSDLPHIFEPFYRSPSVAAAQIHGTGLGLPLAKSIAEAMGGRLSVSSKPGAGSSFTLHLPVTKEVVADAKAELGVAPHPKLS